MPRIFDNIEQKLLPALQDTLQVSERSDFCVGYFNLRGWRHLDSYIDRWSGGEGNCCRLLVGMQRLPQDELRATFHLLMDEGVDNQTAIRLKRKLADEFRNQLTVGVPTNEDEAGLRKLAAQIRAKKVIVKLFLRHPLHAKLYLLYREDPVNPIIGYLGSSNLTFSGLSNQGELNIDVLDNDASKKLADWFENRWQDKWCLDISEELAQIIEESWARETPIPPYHIYLKIAWHLSQEARYGLSEFRIPRDFGNRLFEFQTAAVKIAAHHLNKRGGVLIGDVVGLGKTLMATALARIFEDDFDLETLIICPKNLVPMWEDYREQYRLRAKILSISQATKELPEIRRYRLLLLDESHNLRNREGKRYGAIKEYIERNGCKCIFLSATPYNKTYLDLSNQLRLFVPEDKDLGVRPERLLKAMGEREFLQKHQCPARSLAAFEKSEYPDDWRELMRLYMVRRTRSFIQDNYSKTEEGTGRKYLTFEDGTLSYFPLRTPKTVKFRIEEKDRNDQYARLYAQDVIDSMNSLTLPRYGLGNYIAPPHEAPTQQEAKIIQDLSRAGKRLMGFCRTNLFKRLESCGHSFILSLERHILRNYIFLHAIEHNLPIPIGTQDLGLLDSRIYDGDAEETSATLPFDDEDEENGKPTTRNPISLQSIDDFKRRAAEVYSEYSANYKKRFKWLRPALFVKDLAENLSSDAASMHLIIQKCGVWDSKKDAKLQALVNLVSSSHTNDKVLVFSQFADTVRYLERQLKTAGIEKIAGATGDSENPTALAWHFSPVSNNKRDSIKPEDELRVLIATDVLSEGQNLQDCSIIVNFDLPWAIIRLIQRAGRVDRIGQKSANIFCYSFLPADGVEKIIRLRSRVRKRLKENAEVVGTDESFFEDDRNDQPIVDLYNEKSGILDGDADNEVDLASYAFQIWKNAADANPELNKIIPELPSVVYSTKTHHADALNPPGVLVYLKTADGNDALAWMDEKGTSVTESQLTILKAAECSPDTPPMERREDHHELVQKAVEQIIKEEKTSGGGQLGRPNSARSRTYERLKRHLEDVKGTLFETQPLIKAVDAIYRYPLKGAATDMLNRQLRSGVSDSALAEMVTALWEEERLCSIQEEKQPHEPHIICSMGLVKGE